MSLFHLPEPSWHSSILPFPLLLGHRFLLYATSTLGLQVCVTVPGAALLLLTSASLASNFSYSTTSDSVPSHTCLQNAEIPRVGPTRLHAGSHALHTGDIHIFQEDPAVPELLTSPCLVIITVALTMSKDRPLLLSVGVGITWPLHIPGKSPFFNCL